MEPARSRASHHRWERIGEMRERLAERKRAMERLPRPSHNDPEPRGQAAPASGGRRPAGEIAAPVAEAHAHGPGPEEEYAPELPPSRVTVPQARTRNPLSYLHGATLPQKMLHFAGNVVLEWVPALLTGRKRKPRSEDAAQDRESRSA